MPRPARANRTGRQASPDAIAGLEATELGVAAGWAGGTGGLVGVAGVSAGGPAEVVICAAEGADVAGGAGDQGGASDALGDGGSAERVALCATGAAGAIG